MLIFIFYLCVFIIGLAFGSFLNCLIYRLAHQRSVSGRSFCPKCQHQINWYDNIPLLSFIILRTRCRYCRQKISWQYPIVEVVMGLLFLISVWRVSYQIPLLSPGDVAILWGYQLFIPLAEQYLIFILSVIRDWVIFFTLLFIFVYDLKYTRIEDMVLLPATGLIFILTLVTPSLSGELSTLMVWTRFQALILSMAIGVGFFGLQYLATKGKGIGLGDLRIGLFMGAALVFWPKILVALIFSYLIGAFISLFLIFFNGKKMKSQIPLGPFLVLGTTIALLYSQPIINWYFGQ